MIFSRLAGNSAFSFAHFLCVQNLIVSCSFIIYEGKKNYTFEISHQLYHNYIMSPATG